MKMSRISAMVTFILMTLEVLCTPTIPDKTEPLLERVDKEVKALMETGDIPGLSIVLIRDGKQVIRTYGVSDMTTGKPIRANTLFELGSCSKAFTSLAVLQLEKAGSIHLDSNVSDYLPWFKVNFNGSEAEIKLRELLHHTSGIPWSTISLIPQGNDKDALERTIQKLVGLNLRSLPGEQFEYATINYDVLALVVQKVTHQAFEDYVLKNVFNRLGLTQTSMGVPVDPSQMSTGHKIGFFEPRAYSAPVFGGNNAAGYVISNANDVAKWLKFQLGLGDTSLYQLAKASHARDRKVPVHNLASYGMGWFISIDGPEEIYHSGLNPNYTSFITFRTDRKMGVAVLSNSNSNVTEVIGKNLMKILNEEKLSLEFVPTDNLDKIFSVLTFVLVGYLLIVTAYFFYILFDIHRGNRIFEKFTRSKFQQYALSVIGISPFLYGLYLLPTAIAGFTWDAIIVWAPLSFTVAVLLILTAISATYLVSFFSLWFPEKNRYKRDAPKILLISILTGISNMMLVILVSSGINSTMELKYIVFYFLLALSVYLLGRKFVQTSLIKFTRELIYELRIQLIEKIFSTSYQKFEKIERGRIYTSMNEDVGTIGEATNLFVMLITNLFTAIAAFMYLASIAFWATVVTLLLIGTISTLYYFVKQSTNKYFEQARDSRDVFMHLIHGMIDGFKEISLHRSKKLEYKGDLAASANEYRVKISKANIRFTNAFLIIESLMLILLGVVVFAMPKFFPGIKLYTIMSFVIVLLYLIGPINGILGAVPTILRLQIAWNRVQLFLKEIPANLDLSKATEPVYATVESLSLKNVKFRYRGKSDDTFFEVGPINLDVKRGEILFVIGGNGSGKTTLAKLLTGLYEIDEGEIRINGKVLKSHELGEYFSAAFSPAYLFKKLYSIDTNSKKAEADKYLKMLHLEEKVSIADDCYSTLNLSGGQKKRLALLQCYLEDCPIYLFDEWAADQDPSYRQFFYRSLLPEMRRQGKIVIAITHDDHYFDAADKIIVMNQGSLHSYTQQFTSSIIKNKEPVMEASL